MAAQQTVWPCFPLTLPYYLDREYAGVVVPSPFVRFYNTVCENFSAKEGRQFFLDRSVFDLVEAHHCLELTDPKLLSWFVSLSPDDRQIIQDDGGFYQFLQRHPALELSRHHVYVKYNVGNSSSVQPTITSNKPKSKTKGAKMGKCEMPCQHLELEMLRGNMDNLTLFGRNSRDRTQSQRQKTVLPTSQLMHQQDRFPTDHSSVAQALNHQKTQINGSSPLSQLNGGTPSWHVTSSGALASFTLNVGLEQRRQGGKAELKGQSVDFTNAEVNPLQSTTENTPPEYFSFDSSEIDTVENNNNRRVERVSRPLGSADNGDTIGGCRDNTVRGNEYTVDNNETKSSFNDQSDSFHNIMEDDKSILVCLASEGLRTHDGVQSGSVGTNVEATTQTSKTTRSNQSCLNLSTLEDASNASSVTTCDVMVGTELTLRTSASTQTEDPETSDKNVITEVHMADLDYLAQEFIKIKTAQENQREKSWDSEVRKECACSQRVQQAELRLLTLQYSMCRQHCWTLYCTSAEGRQLTALHEDMNQYRPKDAHVNFLSVLQKLESDYNRMRNQILEGVPLEQLQPLSVDSEKITAGASYVPAQIAGEVLGGLPFWSSLNLQQCNATGEENGDPKNGCQWQEKQVRKEICQSKRAVAFIPHDSQLEEKQAEAVCKELKTNEAWYDAEEELQPAGSSAAAETGQDLTKEGSKESSREETETSLLCVSNLPGDVTESDLMLWFEERCLSGVHVCDLKNDSRVAIVRVSGAQSAEAAARGLNGFSVEGHTLHVEHINGAVDGSQSRASQESSQDATEPPPNKTELSNTEKESTLSSSIEQRKVVSVSPAAKTTWVPQHFGTMGSFDSLTEELTGLHPAVGRPRIMEALVELRATHRGLLRGLPLGVIREMTSQLLSRLEGATQP